LRLRAAGFALRVALVGASLAAGVLLATATLPAAEHLQDQATGHIGLDER
jgi:hypothetical protein